MSVLQGLFESHASNIAKVKGWYSHGEHTPTLKAWVRAEQFVRLDILLMEHRQEFATQWEPLLDYSALTHLVFVRTGWTPEQISHLSFDEILLVLQRDLSKVNISSEELQYPEDVANELQEMRQSQRQIEWPPHSDEEWDPSFCEIAMGLRKPA